MLGWAPTVSLTEGLAPTIAYFRSELGLVGREIGGVA
jgi:CRISPR/Cas system CMR-associated protein Cmr5 small subunit